MSILDAILNASEKDLADLDAKITDHTKQLEAMRSARKVIAERLGVEAPKKAVAKREPTEGGVKPNREASDLAKRIFDLLDREGSMPLPAIAVRLGMAPQGIARAIMAGACAHWFVKKDGEVSIAKGP